MTGPDTTYRKRVDAALAALGIPIQTIRKRRLPLCTEPSRLIVAETGERRRRHQLTPAAARAWKKMKAAAQEDGVGLKIVSAHRSFRRQVEIIKRKLAAGQSIEQILRVSAPPGYSEHHTGCAVDIGTAGCDELEEVFERSDAFKWLVKHAPRFGFFLSYPRRNAYGYQYEPWHWRYRKS